MTGAVAVREEAAAVSTRNEDGTGGGDPGDYDDEVGRIILRVICIVQFVASIAIIAIEPKNLFILACAGTIISAIVGFIASFVDDLYIPPWLAILYPIVFPFLSMMAIYLVFAPDLDLSAALIYHLPYRG